MRFQLLKPWRRNAALRPLQSRHRSRRRPDRRALGDESARQAPLARTLGCRDQRLVDDVALGVAAADADRLVAHREDRFDGAHVIAASEGENAVDETPADLRRDLPIVAGAEALV